eukprot:CAMPEP_0172489444 /NCGR_PEP_ID=MMETSP1066-20121228/19448_1 /TAXON_ID=671091 /ORGANISM="Coscinodiscus wailesii, Strain CCMP2513" /LENGTH=364 /DNA_ID=CAMNT_0013257313 /DNA_START=192 /DNA_END=1286 /DNA_ORIENTATION=-
MSGIGESEQQNALGAFLIVLGAGLATSVGAAVVFFPQLVKLASKGVLAGSLGLSAGVMIYVSMVEIFVKSTSSFENAGYGERSSLYSTLCFFGGIFVMMVLDKIVKCLSGADHHHHHDLPKDDVDQKVTSGVDEDSCESVEVVAPCIACREDPVAELEEWQKMAQVKENEWHHVDDESDVNKEKGSGTNDIENRDNFEINGKQEKEENDHEKKRLVKMGLNTALAIALHNFPEGLATFIASLNDAKVGAVLAVAIAIHNIPEGLCVALPIYYATGNRCKAFLWGFCSGLSEPIAALLGWAILASYFTEEVFAIMFGLVAGMMVMISIRELLPTAHRYDPHDQVVTYSCVFGMAVMAVSLVLFTV